VRPDLDKVGAILTRARQAAIDYYELTGKPLGITGEIGEYFTAHILGLQLAAAREPGFDAIDDSGRKIQIKARAVADPARPGSGRVGKIQLDHPWECVMLILMNKRFEPQVIFEALRSALEDALTRPGSRACNQRGQLAISTFISIGCQVWHTGPDRPKRP